MVRAECLHDLIWSGTPATPGRQVIARKRRAVNRHFPISAASRDASRPVTI